MAYQIGFVPPFENSFLYENKDFQKPKNPEYDTNSLFGYLQKKHPKWFTIIQKANRLNFFQYKSYTMFIPIEQSIPIELITQMDRQTALTLFNYHTLEGMFDKDVLETSRFQNLVTLIPGRDIYLTSVYGINTLNKNVEILEYNQLFDKVIVHSISSLLI